MVKNKAYIITKVGGLYKRYGVKSVTMDDVARELAISKKTLYQYFKDKADLIRQVIRHELDLINEKISAVGERKDLNAIEALFSINVVMYEIIDTYNPALIYDIRKYYPDMFDEFQALRWNRMYKNIYENIKQGQTEGLYRKDMIAEIIAKVHVIRLQAKQDVMFEIAPYTRQDVYKEIFIYHLRGICSPAGIKFFEEKLTELKKQGR